MSKVEKVLSIDIRKPGSEKKLRQILAKLSWFERFAPEDITLDVLEKCYLKVTKKYPGELGYVLSSGDKSWVFMVRNSETGDWIHSVHAITLWEGLAKCLIVLYAHFIKNIPFYTKEV